MSDCSRSWPVAVLDRADLSIDLRVVKPCKLCTYNMLLFWVFFKKNYLFFSRLDIFFYKQKIVSFSSIFLKNSFELTFDQKPSCPSLVLSQHFQIAGPHSLNSTLKSRGNSRNCLPENYYYFLSRNSSFLRKKTLIIKWKIFVMLLKKQFFFSKPMNTNSSLYLWEISSNSLRNLPVIALVDFVAD